MQFHDFLIIFFGFISEVLGTLSGFGSSTFFVPLALFFEKFTFVITLTSILHTFSNFFKLIFFRNQFHPKLLFRLAIPSIVFCIIGAFVVNEANLRLIKIALGFFLIILSALALLNISRPKRLTTNQAVALCSLSGFLTGFIGTGGALRGLALGGLNLSKESFVFLSSSIDAGGDFLRMIIYLSKGYMEWEQWYYIPMLIVAASIGTFIGKKLMTKISQNTFEKIVLFFSFMSGLLLILDS